VSAMALPGVCDAQPLSAVGEELLTAALRASLLSLHPTAAEETRSSALRSAHSCIGIFAAFALKAAGQQFEILQRSTALLSASERPSRGGIDGASQVRVHLHNYCHELRRLRTALQLWIEDAMIGASLDDAPTRRAVFEPLKDVSSHAAHCVAAAMELLGGEA